MTRRWRLLVGVGLTASGLVMAAGASEFEAALADATSKGETGPGTAYTTKYVEILGRHVASAMDACGPSFPDMTKPAYIVLTVAADGRVTRKMSDPNSTFGQCIASHLPASITLPRPPSEGWPIVVGVQNRYHAQTEAGGAPASKGTLTAYDDAIAPYVAKGRATYPAAKARFQKGLPGGNKFMVRVRLTQKPNKVEEVFLEVNAIQGGTVSGTINRVDILTNYRKGERISVPESEVKDWLIQRPDGSQEGNAVGKYLTQHKI